MPATTAKVLLNEVSCVCNWTRPFSCASGPWFRSC